MSTERDFLNRLDSISSNITERYKSEDQIKAIEAQRDLTDLGVVSAFQEVINRGIIVAERDSDKPVHIEFGSSCTSLGYFLVYKDREWWVEPSGDYSGFTNASKEAIGVLRTGAVYEVGRYNCGHKDDADRSKWHPATNRPSYSNQIATKLIFQRNEVLNELATLVAIFRHNKRAEQTGSCNYLNYP